MKQKAHNFLRKLRKEYGYTQEDVANWIGLKRSNYNRKETGQITLFADEFLNALLELQEKGPKKKIKPSVLIKKLPKLISD